MSWRYEEYEAEIIPYIFPQSPLIPPFKNLILRRTNLSFFLSSSIENAFIDEVYHENSKLSPFVNSFSSMQNYLKNLKYLFIKDKKKSIEAFYKIGGIYESFKNLKEKERNVLTFLKNSIPFFFGFYCILWGKKYTLFKFERPEFLLLVKELKFDVNNYLKENLFIYDSEELKPLNLEKPFLVIFLFMNHHIIRSIFGLRGYRIALIECGRLIKMIENEMNNSQMKVTSTSIFYDNSLNRLLGLDGHNFSVQGVIIVEEK